MEEGIQKKPQGEIEPKKDEKEENKNNSNEEGEYENIYIIKKKSNKQERQEIPKEKRNNKDYNHYNYNIKNNYYYKGVFNFCKKHLEQILNNCNIKPIINQIKCNPIYYNEKTINHSEQN